MGRRDDAAFARSDAGGFAVVSALARSSRLCSCLAATAFVAQDGECQSPGVTMSWTAQGATASWADVANWSTGALPTSADASASPVTASAPSSTAGPTVAGAIEVRLVRA